MGLSLKDAIARSIPRVREDAVIESRADLLPAADRDLVLAVWTYHQPTRMVADMRGTSADAVRRRLRVLIDRLHSDHFIGAARVMRLLNPGQAEVARLHFCYGLSVRATARATGVGYHETRRLAAEVSGLIVGLKKLRAERERSGDGAAGHARSRRASGRRGPAGSGGVLQTAKVSERYPNREERLSHQEHEEIPRPGKAPRSFAAI